MGFTTTQPAPTKTHPTAKNRVREIFATAPNPRRSNRPRTKQPHRKNPTSPPKPASDVLFELYRYTAFGQVEVYAPNGSQLAGTAIDNPVRWNSRRYDEATQLHYYKYRWFDPKLGRWLGRDPIEENGGINLYAFVRNDSVNQFDYFGLRWPSLPEDFCTKQRKIRDLITHLGRRVGRFMGVQTPDSHWTTINDQCRKVDDSLNLIDQICCDDASREEERRKIRDDLLRLQSRCGLARQRAVEFGLAEDTSVDRLIENLRAFLESPSPAEGYVDTRTGNYHLPNGGVVGPNGDLSFPRPVATPGPSIGDSVQNWLDRAPTVPGGGASPFREGMTNGGMIEGLMPGAGLGRAGGSLFNRSLQLAW